MFFRKKDMHRKLLVVLTNFIWKFENLETFKWCIKIAFPDAFHERNLDSCSTEEVKVFMPSPWSVKRTTPLSFEVEFISKNEYRIFIDEITRWDKIFDESFCFIFCPRYIVHFLPHLLTLHRKKKERKKMHNSLLYFLNSTDHIEINGYISNIFRFKKTQQLLQSTALRSQHIKQTIQWKWRHNEVFVKVFFDFIDNDFTGKTHAKFHVLSTRVCIQQTKYRCWF